jgi:hypothetical protein
MENNLYYTPTIEEFHVGFEYRNINNLNIGYTCKDILPKEYNEELIRVKYLDQFDIESLGWIDGETRGMTPFIFNELDPNNEFQLYYQFDNQFAQIYNCHSDFVFQGTIKNKSELIKLMQQLNIK